jgi:glycosyltransferase involved in cell wall biosynthesis
MNVTYRRAVESGKAIPQQRKSTKTTTPVVDISRRKSPSPPEILFVTSYPPRECGIATYSQDLLRSIREKFGQSFSLKVCALEVDEEQYSYPEEVKYVLRSSDSAAYEDLAAELNLDDNLSLVIVQHEFGLFGGEYGQYLLGLICMLNKPVITTFHTILPHPDELRKRIVATIARNSVSIIVMTKNAANILERAYSVPTEKIAIIPHGTHVIPPVDDTVRPAKKHFSGRLLLTTFGLLGPGKSIETALDALPEIVRAFPNVLYLIIGKTHPTVVKHDGEQYRNLLQQKVIDLDLKDHVRFINRYLSLPALLGYLQRTDIYLFTSKDPDQAVSGTFSYAMGCGCPIISTPIPHAKELLDGAGIMVPFQSPGKLAEATKELLANTELRNEMKLNALHKIRPTAWPNSALAHVDLAMRHIDTGKVDLQYVLPPIVLTHIKKQTTERGMIQFSQLSLPDLQSGYTLDDNARALIALSRYYNATNNPVALPLIETYLNFIIYCQQEDGTFLNYVDNKGVFVNANGCENLEDANGRGVWALGEFVGYGQLFHQRWTHRAETALLKSLPHAISMRSPRAIAFVIKGLFHYYLKRGTTVIQQHIISLADDLVAKYRGVSDKKWEWFEEYLTYANAVIPEALLCAYMSTGNVTFKTVAKSCFDFLERNIFSTGEIKVVSNHGWLVKGGTTSPYGEQPIDIAYTILALSRFHEVFPLEGYEEKMQVSFDWFLGRNHLRQNIYDSVTGGCYDGLEEHHVNLNQGAESTVSYLISRLKLDSIKVPE